VDEQFQFLMLISLGGVMVALVVGYGIKVGCLLLWKKIKGE